MIDFFNAEADRFDSTYPGLDKRSRDSKITGFIDTDQTKISWNRGLKQEFSKGTRFSFEPDRVIQSLYRPFTKQWMYFHRRLNDMVYQMPRIFPDEGVSNSVIMLPGPGEDRPFSVFLSQLLPDLHSLHGGQCFPLNLYEETDVEDSDDLFGKDKKELSQTSYTRRDAITDTGLSHFQEAYPGEGTAIGKELPRIPAVKQFADFMAYSQAGRELAHWHLNYESVALHPGAKLDYGKNKEGGHSCPPDSKETTGMSPLPKLYRVTKMKFAKQRDPETGKMIADKTRVIYNSAITISDIPLEAYAYVVNGKSALEWVMERQAVTVDKKSGIENDANLWATETIGDAKYPLELFLRVITVSLEPMKIVDGLPKLELPIDSQS
jgi:predicted helicase